MPLSEKVLHLRIDVDTVHGITKGVPWLLELLNRLGASATFFVPMGPDKLVWAGFRRLLKRDFVSQTVQMNPVKVYGIPYLLKGITGMNGCVGTDHPDMLLKIRNNGHEVALHSWDHAWWGDYLMENEESTIKQQIEMAFLAFSKIFNEDPHGFGAPGLRCSEASLRALDHFHFRYISETEGSKPSYLTIGEYTNTTLNLPITATPIFEQYYRSGFNDDKTIERMLSSLIPDSFNHFVIHAEYEVFSKRTILFRFLEQVTAFGYKISRLDSFFDTLPANSTYDTKTVLYKNSRGTVGPSAYIEEKP